MPTDQIAELRALLADEELKYRRHKMEPGRDSWVQHQDAEYALQQVAVERLPALLDCADALRDLLQESQHAEHTCDDEVFCPVKNGHAALRALNGDDNE